ncbi:unnamed protein product [Hermetia illucens]|uniref:RING-type domain-containing protein n=2 Tax=Hermetia illucens TaxID=343691 RepID=A0A7R8UCH8_HERIL|nr:unnamed protein product [Hermetia illucens]
MITLAATAASDVVAVANATTATSPATAEPMVVTSASATTSITTVASVGTATNTPTRGIVASNNSRATAMTTRPATIRRRLKVKEFNDLISCSLCSGYLINATTSDHCGHWFCRSCILRHCKTSKHCPKSKCGKPLSLSNLRLDEQLKTLVYKLVPGLYHNEIERQLQWGSSDGKDEAVNQDSEEDFFSPVEPISLSLEYHPDSLASFRKDQIPPVRYLQCPAAVTVHHLQRLISSKFNIDMENLRVDIEIIYDDEILPDDFSLMDIGYCYSWKRDSPMRLFYRILVHNLCNKAEQVTINTDSVVAIIEENIEAKHLIKSKEQTSHNKTVRFKEHSSNGTSKEHSKKQTGSSISTLINVKNEKTKPVKDYDDEDDDDNSYKNSRTTYTILKPKINDELQNLNHNNNNNNSVSSKHKKEKEKHLQAEPPKESVKVTIIARKTDIKVKSGKNKPKRSSSPKTPEATPSSDFKSLRSNDVRYMNDYTTGTNTTTTKQHKSKSTPKETSKAATPKCDIFVSIPQSGHRSSNSSDDSSENLSLAQLKSASKKNSHTVQLKQSTSLDESLLPKLKITVAKTSPTAKVRKLSSDDRPVEHVDLTTYAKHIGLKPINQPSEEKKDIKLKIGPGNSPSSSVSSSSASSPPSAAESGFVFNTDAPISSHKKRKKAKHSKESKESSSKKRRLHAEISSPAAEESLKLKVKITGNPKSYRAERKASSSSDEVVITSPVVTEASSSATSSSTISNAMNKELQKPPTNSKPMVNIPITLKTPSNGSKNIASAIKTIPDVQPTKDGKTAKEAVAQKSSTQKSVTPTVTIPISKPASPRSSTVTNSTPAPVTSVLTPKLQLTKIQSIQDTKLHASPPLPPSLFKTAPMALQPLGTVKNSVMHQSRSSLPVSENTNLSGNRLTPVARTTTPFAVPNAPRKPNSPNSPKLSPICTIASAANRQLQLKRSASLDGNPSSMAKQQKVDQEKFIRKTPYTPPLNKLSNSPAAAATTPTGNGIKAQPRNSSIAVVTNPTQKPQQPPYYTSPMANTYTHEIQAKKPTLITLPPSSISVTKMPDTSAGSIVQSSTGLTITPQQLTPPLSHSAQQQKPALEIVRIQSNIPPIDQQKPTVTNNNTIKPTPPKTTRPLPPTIPLVKIKRSTNQINPLKSTVTTVSAPIQQQALLSINNITKPAMESTASKTSVNGVSKLEQKVIDVDQETSKKVTSSKVTSVCDTTGVLDLSGKSSRSPSHDKNSPPLTPISPNQSQSSVAQNSAANNIEAALNKIKQQMAQISPTSTTPTSTIPNSTTILSTVSVTTSSSTTQASAKSEASSNDTHTSIMSPIPAIGLNSTNLQNLKMLSESATSREKIAIKNQKPLSTLAVPKLNEISKVRQPAIAVRQQNASVRNIPNPSALTLRNQQVPMLTSISKTSTTTSKTTTSTSNTLTSGISAGLNEPKPTGLSSNFETKPQPASPSTSATVSPSTFTSSLAKSSSPAVSTTSSASSDASKLLTSKKNFNIEQVAASLNMRAAAAAGERSTIAKNVPSTTSPSTTSSMSFISPLTSPSSGLSTTASTTASSTVTSISQTSVASTTTSASVVSTTTSAPVISATTT